MNTIVINSGDGKDQKRSLGSRFLTVVSSLEPAIGMYFFIELFDISHANEVPHILQFSSAVRERIKDRIKTAIDKLDRYSELKEKAEKIDEWNDIVHDLSDLISNYGVDMPASLRENLQTVMNFTSPPQDQVDNVKSSMEEAMNFYDEARVPNDHTHISRAEIVMMGVAAALIIASSIAFYLTQYAVATFKIVNDNCSPMKFENSGQIFSLAKVPRSVIENGGYARIVIPAGSISMDMSEAGMLHVKYLFGQSIYIAMSDEISGLRLDGNLQTTSQPFSIDLQKDSSSKLIITCS